MPYHQMF